MDIPNLNNIAILAIIAPIAAFWSQIKSVISNFFSYFIRTDTIKGYDLAKSVFKDILDHSKVIKWGNTSFDGTKEEYIKKSRVYTRMVLAAKPSIIALYKHRIPLLIKSDDHNSMKITYLFKTLNLREIITRVSKEEFNTRCKERELEDPDATGFYINEVNGDEPDFAISSGDTAGGGAPQATPQAQKKESSGNVLMILHFLMKHADVLGFKYSDIGWTTSNVKNPVYYWQSEGLVLKNEIEFWLKNRSWYEEREISWKRGALLYGKPGTGKTKMVEECAKALSIPIYKFNISNMTDGEFVGALNKNYGYGRIVLIEDIDVIFNGRENMLAGNNKIKQLLSFDCLINTIGGIKNVSGNFFVVSTNNFEALDEAFTRSGRLDAKIEVGPINEEGRRLIANNILRDWPNLVEEAVKKYDGWTVAEFENKCIEIAIDTFNKQRLLK